MPGHCRGDVARLSGAGPRARAPVLADPAESEIYRSRRPVSPRPALVGDPEETDAAGPSDRLSPPETPPPGECGDHGVSPGAFHETHPVVVRAVFSETGEASLAPPQPIELSSESTCARRAEDRATGET
ncbi:MAG: hypothetical protein ACFFGZ_16490 [Candidatus Thorarchaeota archaeon]